MSYINFSFCFGLLKLNSRFAVYAKFIRFQKSLSKYKINLIKKINIFIRESWPRYYWYCQELIRSSLGSKEIHFPENIYSEFTAKFLLSGRIVFYQKLIVIYS